MHDLRSREGSPKISKIINDFGGSPLQGTLLTESESLNATPETILAMVIDSMIKAKPISHQLAQKTFKELIGAGYHDIEVLGDTSWEDRVEVLKNGGYNRYREQCATNLGELADLVVEKYGMLHIASAMSKSSMGKD